jgi:hypothetical protein
MGKVRGVKDEGGIVEKKQLKVMIMGQYVD